jgi:phosphohistidine phosphatase SixA
MKPDAVNSPSRRTILLATAGALAWPGTALATALPAAAVLDLLRRPGHIAFMRHALAPFEGAPKESGRDADDLGPCETQRNLDEVGRNDARRIGALLRTSGIVFEHVYTSKWCRCRETAALIMGRPVDNLPLIDSYYTSPRKAEKGPRQIAGLKAFLNQTLKPTDRALMVTHGSLISDLTRIDTGETEMVVVKADGRGDVAVVGHGIV